MKNKSRRLIAWRSMTINMMTCSEKYEERLDGILEIANSKSIDVLAIQEFKRRGKDSRKVTNSDGTIWDIYWTGFEKKREQGVAIAVKRTRQIEILKINQISPRMMWVELKVRGMTIRVYSIYAPTNCPNQKGNEAARAEFWRQLRKESKSDDSRLQHLYLGDFNATTNLVKANSPTYYGKNKKYNVDFKGNENGEALAEFCATRSLGLLNSFFHHNQQQIITHHSNNGFTKKTLDYALASQMLANHCMDVRVRNSYLLELLPNCDHRCLVQRWKTPATKTDYPKSKPRSPPAPDLALLKNEDFREKFLAEFKIQNSQNPTPNNLTAKSENLTATALSTAEKILPKKQKEQENLPWRYDEKLKELKAKRSKINYKINKNILENSQK